MAFAKKDLADLKQSLADRISSGTLPNTSEQTKWTRFLNRAKDYCIRKMRIKPSAQSLTTSSGSVAVPDAILVAHSVYNASNVPITQIKFEESIGASGNVYWIAGDYENGFTFNVPSGNDGTYRVFFSTEFEDMSSDSDICPVPDAEAVVAHAYGMLRKSQTDPLEDADSSLAECDRRMDDVLDQLQMNNGGINFVSAESQNSTWWDVL